jgi:hypothetical protein
MRFSKKYDVFISYAIEDKYPVAETIASSLKQNGIKVWYVGSELKVGDAISTVISEGLRNSNYCILILSPFYTRHWTLVELYRFIEKEQLEKKILILPVWHNIDYKEAKEKYPMIADRYAMSTQKGLDAVSESLCEVIRKKKKSDLLHTIKMGSAAAIFLATCVIAILFLWQKYSSPALHLPSKQFVQNAIEKQSADFQAKLENNLRKKVVTSKGKAVPLDSITGAYNMFVTTSKRERNEYRFTGQSTIMSGYKNIEDLGVTISDAPYDGYGISSPTSYLTIAETRFYPDTVFNYSFILLNRSPLSFTIDTLYASAGHLHAHVTYKQNIRSVEGTLTYPNKTAPVRKQQIQLTGYKPSEEYVFELKNGVWSICEVK